MNDMTDPEDTAAHDRAAAVYRSWREQATRDWYEQTGSDDLHGFAILDRAEMEAFMATTDPTPDEVQAWLKARIKTAEAEREAIAHLDPDTEG